MAYDDSLSFVYFGPTKIIFGSGSSTGELESEMSALGCSRAVVVTDQGIIKAGLSEKIIKTLGEKCVGVFSDVPQDTGIDVVNRGAAFAREKGADIIISIGGGSVIDTAKCICILLTEGGSLANYEGIQLLTRPQTPHIVIPTTAGTGSEVTWIAVVYDKDKGQKILIVESYNAPRAAILDPQLTLGLPPLLTASTGMDAMTHAIEAMTSMQREPIADAMALHAIRLLSDYLPVCIKDGGNIRARGQVQMAATMAGWAFGNAMVGLVHAMAHSIGAVARVPHGVSCGIMLPYCMDYNIGDGEPETIAIYAAIAQALGVSKRDDEPGSAAMAAVQEIFDLLRKIGHPLKLSELGVTEEDIIKAADLSIADGAIVNNIRYVTGKDEVLEIYRRAL
ncbi:MAG: aldehyde dehydrogenase [Syntrophaceae bacterium]|nr:MAG: aldehyde dehydrogenase [Syntrophaceae bacterium]